MDSQPPPQRTFTRIAAAIVVAAVAVVVVTAVLAATMPVNPGGSTARSTTGVCLIEVPNLNDYYSNGTSQGYAVTYPDGTTENFPLNSCPVPVLSDAYGVDSIVETDHRFIAAENSSAYMAGNSCTCSLGNDWNNSTGAYVTLYFVSYGSQRIYLCGGNSSWIYDQLGSIQVIVPVESTGGLQYSHMEVQAGPGDNSTAFYWCTTSITE
jgi:hypothetical protein